MLKILLGFYCSVVICSSAPTESNGFTFATYYNDHMVLQKQPQRANIWGHSTKIGDVVDISIKGPNVSHSITTKVYQRPDGKGVWNALPPPIKAGGPYTIEASSSLGKIVLSDVLFGDVWICSGQSNMQFTLSMGSNLTEELNDSVNYPNIRLFTARRKESKTPLYDLLDVEQQWSIPSAKSLGGSKWTYFSSVCWFYGKNLYKNLNYPIGLMAADWGGTLVESWSSQDAIAKCDKKMFPYGPQPGFPREQSVIWNAMINPLVNLTIYGAVWYQGESNSGNWDGYNCSFPAMIDDWRQKFNEGSSGQTSDKFPFGFVQLAPFRNDPKLKQGFTGIRWSQTAGYGYVPNPRLQNVFMSVTVDLPDFDSPNGAIHPRHKRDVARRLALGGLGVAYHKTGLKYQGPYPSDVKLDTKESTITVTFDHGKTPLDIRAKNGFDVCCTTVAEPTHCSDLSGTWHPLPIISFSSTSVTLKYPDECYHGRTRLNALRYLWQESPCAFKKCPVYSTENELPAAPFKYIFEGVTPPIIG